MTIIFIGPEEFNIFGGKHKFEERHFTTYVNYPVNLMNCVTLEKGEDWETHLNFIMCNGDIIRWDFSCGDDKMKVYEYVIIFGGLDR